MYRDAGVLVLCQYVAAMTATQEASCCVHTLVVTRVAAWVLTLINVCVYEKKDIILYYIILIAR